MKQTILITLFLTSAFFSFAQYQAKTDLRADTRTDDRTEVASPKMESASWVNAKAAQDFNQRFPTLAADWIALPDHSTMARASSPGKLRRVFYARNGRWLNTVTSMDGATLPEKIRNDVHLVFGDVTIPHADQIEKPGSDPV